MNSALRDWRGLIAGVTLVVCLIGFIVLSALGVSGGAVSYLSGVASCCLTYVIGLASKPFSEAVSELKTNTDILNLVKPIVKLVDKYPQAEAIVDTVEPLITSPTPDSTPILNESETPIADETVTTIPNLSVEPVIVPDSAPADKYAKYQPAAPTE